MLRRRRAGSAEGIGRPPWLGRTAGIDATCRWPASGGTPSLILALALGLGAAACGRSGELLLERPRLEGRLDAGSDAVDAGSMPGLDAGALDAGRLDAAVPDAGPLSPGAGHTCDRPITLQPGVFSPPVPWPEAESERCNGDKRPQVHFAVEVPPGHALRLYGDPADVRETCGGSCPMPEDTWFNEGRGPMRLSVSAFQWQPEDREAQMMARVTRVAAHGQCWTPRRVRPGEVVRGEDILAGGRFHRGCRLIEDRGQTLYYLVDLELGKPPWRVRLHARPRDRQNLSMSLQAFLFEPVNGQCPSPGGRCGAFDEPYFRSAPDSSLEVDVSFGGGRNPVRILIAASMNPSWDADASTLFDLEVEELP